MSTSTTRPQRVFPGKLVLVNSLRAVLFAAGAILGLAGFLLWQYEHDRSASRRSRRLPKTVSQPTAPAVKPAKPAAPSAAEDARETPPPPPHAPLPRLENPPDVVKGVYLTSWSAGIKRRIDYVLELRKTTALNAVVIDVKDYSGYVTYRSAVPELKRYGAIRATVRDIDAVVSRLHQEGVYVIARITVFQDPVLAMARPEWAVHRASKLPAGAKKPPLTPESLWLDHKGLAWLDPASKEVWDYVVTISSDVLSHGFDELNFDYVRFPSDGDIKDMHFPFWDGRTPKREVIRAFFAHLRKNLDGVPISADLFGLATVNGDDLGIGQVIEDGYAGFDVVCPMVYPSHYARKFLGFPNPAQHPYEVVNYSIQKAAGRLETFLRPRPGSKAGLAANKVKIRPWLQDFDLGARYDSPMVQAQVKAVEDALGERYAGYLLWSSRNVYTEEAIE